MSAAIDRTRLSAQQLADVALIERLQAKAKREGRLSDEDKRIVALVARRAPLASRDALVAHVDRLLARDGIAPVAAPAPRPEPVGPFASVKDRETFIDDVLGLLGCEYELPNGERIQGEAYTRLRSNLVSRYGWLPGGRRWRGLSNCWTFDAALEAAGFKVVEARVVRYFRGGVRKAGQRCRAVTL